MTPNQTGGLHCYMEIQSIRLLPLRTGVLREENLFLSAWQLRSETCFLFVGITNVGQKATL